MNKVLKLQITLASGLLILLLGACAQTVGHFTPTVASNPDNGVFYIYRPAATSPGLMKPLKFDYPDILVDGQSIGVLKYDQYLVTELPPGAHKVTVTGLTTASSGWAERDIEQTIQVSRGEPVFLKLRVEYDIEKMPLGEMSAKYLIDLLPISEEDARYEIRNTTAASN